MNWEGKQWNTGVQIFKINFRPSHYKTRRTSESDLPLASVVSLRTQLFFHAVPSIFVGLTKAGSGLWWLQNPQLKLVARNIYGEMKVPEAHSRDCRLPAECPHNAKATKKALRGWLCLFDLANLADSGSLALPEAPPVLCMASGK